jgi:hypothetical protein
MIDVSGGIPWGSPLFKSTVLRGNINPDNEEFSTQNGGRLYLGMAKE